MMTVTTTTGNVVPVGRRRVGDYETDLESFGADRSARRRAPGISEPGMYGRCGSVEMENGRLEFPPAGTHEPRRYGARVADIQRIQGVRSSPSSTAAAMDGRPFTADSKTHLSSPWWSSFHPRLR